MSMYLVCSCLKCIYIALWFLAVGGLDCGFSAFFLTPQGS